MDFNNRPTKKIAEQKSSLKRVCVCVGEQKFLFAFLHPNLIQMATAAQRINSISVTACIQLYALEIAINTEPFL